MKEVLSVGEIITRTILIFISDIDAQLEFVSICWVVRWFGGLAGLSVDGLRRWRFSFRKERHQCERSTRQSRVNALGRICEIHCRAF